MNNLSQNSKLTVVANASAAGTTAVDSSSVDMTGYDSVMFVCQFGTIVSGAVTSVNLAQSADDSSFADLLASSVTVADDDDDQAVWLDLHKPGDRYVRLEVAKATQNSTVEAILAIQYNHKLNKPPTHDATTILGGELHISPAEGTA